MLTGNVNLSIEDDREDFSEIEKHARTLLEYKGAKGLLYLQNPFQEGQSNSLGEGLIAGEARFLKQEFRETSPDQLPGIHLNSYLSAASSPHDVYIALQREIETI